MQRRLSRLGVGYCEHRWILPVNVQQPPNETVQQPATSNLSETASTSQNNCVSTQFSTIGSHPELNYNFNHLAHIWSIFQNQATRAWPLN